MENVVNFSVIKEKIIKTDAVLCMVKTKQDELKKVHETHNALKIRYNNNKTEITRLQIENQRINHNYEQLKLKYEPLSAEHKKLKQDYVKQQNDHLLLTTNLNNSIQFYQIEVDGYKKQVKQCCGHKITDDVLVRGRPSKKTDKLEREVTKLNSKLESITSASDKEIAQLKLENAKLLAELSMANDHERLKKSQDFKVLNEKLLKTENELQELKKEKEKRCNIKELIELRKQNEEFQKVVNEYVLEISKLKVQQEENEEIYKKTVLNLGKFQEQEEQELALKIKNDEISRLQSELKHLQQESKQFIVCSRVNAETQTESNNNEDSDDDISVSNMLMEMKTIFPNLVSPMPIEEIEANEGGAVIEDECIRSPSPIEELTWLESEPPNEIPEIIITPPTPIEKSKEEVHELFNTATQTNIDNEASIEEESVQFCKPSIYPSKKIISKTKSNVIKTKRKKMSRNILDTLADLVSEKLLKRRKTQRNRFKNKPKLSIIKDGDSNCEKIILERNKKLHEAANSLNDLSSDGEFSIIDEPHYQTVPDIPLSFEQNHNNFEYGKINDLNLNSLVKIPVQEEQLIVEEEETTTYHHHQQQNDYNFASEKEAELNQEMDDVNFNGTIPVEEAQIVVDGENHQKSHYNLAVKPTELNYIETDALKFNNLSTIPVEDPQIIVEEEVTTTCKHQKTKNLLEQTHYNFTVEKQAVLNQEADDLSFNSLPTIRIKEAELVVEEEESTISDHQEIENLLKGNRYNFMEQQIELNEKTGEFSVPLSIVIGKEGTTTCDHRKINNLVTESTETVQSNNDLLICYTANYSPLNSLLTNETVTKNTETVQTNNTSLNYAELNNSTSDLNLNNLPLNPVQSDEPTEVINEQQITCDNNFVESMPVQETTQNNSHSFPFAINLNCTTDTSPQISDDEEIKLEIKDWNKINNKTLFGSDSEDERTEKVASEIEKPQKYVEHCNNNLVKRLTSTRIRKLPKRYEQELDDEFEKKPPKRNKKKLKESIKDKEYEIEADSYDNPKSVDSGYSSNSLNENITTVVTENEKIIKPTSSPIKRRLSNFNNDFQVKKLRLGEEAKPLINKSVLKLSNQNKVFDDGGRCNASTNIVESIAKGMIETANKFSKKINIIQNVKLNNNTFQYVQPLNTCKSQSLPVVIPVKKILGTASPMSEGRVKYLFKKLITFSAEEKALEEVCEAFLEQNSSFITNAILNKLSTDFSTKPDNKYQPAPILTDLQRILLGFILKLESMGKENFSNDFLIATEKKLLSNPELHQISPLTRLYLAICKHRKDLNRIRKLCCEAFYFIGDLAVPLFFTVLTSWSEVLPMESESEEFVMAKVLVQIIFMKTCNKPGYNLIPLRDLLVKYYKYPTERWNSDEIFKEIFYKYSRNPVRLSDFTILLYCKNHSEKWVYQKIEENFLPLFKNIKSENFKAAVIILIGNLVSQFKPDLHMEYIVQIESWLQNLSSNDEVPDIVRRSVQLSLSRLPKLPSEI